MNNNEEGKHQDQNDQKNQSKPQQKQTKMFNNQWILKKKISSGSFGVVFLAFDKNTKEQVAIKLEKEDNEEIKSLDREVQILTRLQGLSNIPKLYYQGQENNYNILVVSLLGPDLAHYMKQYKKFSLQTVLCLADQLIPVLENIHNRGIIHRDLKPENILMGINDTARHVYLIDFGISKIFRDSNGRHISYRDNKPFIGTTRYASIAAHQGHELGRKDDLESLIYVLLFLLKGNLPWQNLQNVSDRDKTNVVGEIKEKTSAADLCRDLPAEFQKYLEYLKKLHFKSTPDYKYLRQLFQKLGKENNVQYGKADNFEYIWTEAEKKKAEEQKQKELQIQEQKRQEKQKQEEQEKLKEAQQNNQNRSVEMNINNSVPINKVENNLDKKPPMQNNIDGDKQQQQQYQEKRFNNFHRTMSFQEQNKKNKDLLQLPGKQNQMSQSPSNHQQQQQQQSTRDSYFKIGSTHSNSFMGSNLGSKLGSYSSVYINYVPSNMKNSADEQQVHRHSLLGMSNINFDEIDHEAEKMIKGSNLNMFDDNNKTRSQLGSDINIRQKQSSNFKRPDFGDEEIPEEQDNSQAKQADQFTMDGRQTSGIDEFPDIKNTLNQKYKTLLGNPGDNNYNLKTLKQKTKFSQH